MRRPVLSTLLALTLALAVAGCGSSDGSDGSDGASGEGSTTEAPAATDTTLAPTTTTEVATPDGDAVAAGDLPAPWADASADTTAYDLGEVDPTGSPAVAVPCPPTVAPEAGGSAQCQVYVDEGGPWASLAVKAADGTGTTTLLCAASDGSFVASASLVAPTITAGPGTADAAGRAVQAHAYAIDGTTRWYVVRRPTGQPCPVVFDLGAQGAGSPSSGAGSVSLPLADGPTCVFPSTEGLVVRPGDDTGACLP